MRKYGWRCLLLAVLMGETGCAEEKKQIVVPVAGSAQHYDYYGKKAEMLEWLRTSYPKLSPNALDAFDSIARMFFVTDVARHRSFDDKALPIGSGQSTLKLSDIAFLITELDLQPTDNVLEVGTGTGYFAAILSRLVDTVNTVEVLEYLYEIARQRMDGLQITNVKLRNGDGLQGWSRRAPYDVVIITAAVKAIPQAILAQLKTEARLAAPILDAHGDCEWVLYRWQNEALEEIGRKPTRIPPAIEGL